MATRRLAFTPWAGSPGVIASVVLSGALQAAALPSAFAGTGTSSGLAAVLDAQAQASTFAGAGSAAGAGILTAQAQASAFAGAGASQPESRVAATMGPFPTSATSLSVASAYDWAAGVTKLSAFEVTARTGNQSLVGSAGTTGGYQYQFSNTAMSLFFTGGTTMAFTEGPPAIGVNIMADSWKSAGSLRGTKNGAAVVQRHAGPTYVAVTGTPSTTLGRHAGATASACTATKYLWEAHLNREATDAEMQEWTDNVNQLDRYRPPATLVAAINATAGSWLWDAYTDYSTSSSTSVTGIGTGPTWTRNGTPAKVTIEEEIEHTISLSDWHFNVLNVATAAQSSGPTYNRGNAFREFRFTSNAARFAVKGICDWSGAVNMANLGVRQDDTPIGPLNFDRFSVWRRLDVTGLSGSHVYRVIDGAQSLLGGVTAGVYNSTAVKAITSVLVQAPKTATFTVSAPSAAANRLVVMGDSFTVGQWSTVTPTTESEVMMLRADYPGDVIAFTCGAFAHWHFFKDSTTYNAFTTDLATAFSGATSKRILDLLGTNDQGFHSSFWTNRADFLAKTGAGFDAINTASSTTRIHVRTALLRTGAYEGSTVTDATPTAGTGAGTAVGGVILQNNRDDMATVTSTRSGYILTTRNGVLVFPNFAASSNHGSDSFHPSGWTGGVASGGHNTIKIDAKAQLAAASDTVGSGY